MTYTSDDMDEIERALKPVGEAARTRFEEIMSSYEPPYPPGRSMIKITKPEFEAFVEQVKEICSTDGANR